MLPRHTKDVFKVSTLRWAKKQTLVFNKDLIKQSIELKSLDTFLYIEIKLIKYINAKYIDRQLKTFDNYLIKFNY